MRAKRKVRRAARYLFGLCRISGMLDEGRVRQVAGRIARSGRHGRLRMLQEFQRLVRLDRGRYTALVESAMPLDDRLRRRVQNDLARLYGPAVTTSFQQDPALIGGMRIKVGSDVYDGSVRAKLAALNARW